MEQYILLTGGHSGIGLALTKMLLKPGNKIGLIIRDETRQQQVMSAFDAFPKTLVNDIDFFFADLSVQQQVRAVAQHIMDKWPRIDRLFNNAGVIAMKGDRKQSKQGNEWHFEINTLAPYLLTTELKPLLMNSADAKVVTTVTGGMGGRKLRTDQILDDNFSKGIGLYQQSKQAVMLLMNDLADEMPGVEFLSVNPGTIKTRMSLGDKAPILLRFMARLFFSEPEMGGQRLYNAAYDARFSAENRVFLQNDKVVPIKHSLSAVDKTALLARIA
ncbi:MAG: SDR family NAD(P)-dependent oxidoreductase [Chloroflexota bacterium]